MKELIALVLLLVFSALAASAAADTISAQGTFYNPTEIQSLATRYTIIRDGRKYKAIDSGGSIAYSSRDPGAVLQSAIDAVHATGGRIVLRDGDTFTYTSTIPQFRPNTKKWVSIVGYGATIRLMVSAYRAFDFDKQADFDVFGRIHLEGFTVDANLVKTSRANHVLLGFNKDNNRARDVSVDRIIVKNVRVLDVYADGTGADHALVLHLSPRCTRGAAQEPYLRNIWVSGMEILGGEAGIAVTVSDRGSSGAYRCFIENVYIHDNSVSLGENSGNKPPGAFYAGTGIFVGGDVRYTKDVHISNNYVQHAGDNCYEISAPINGVSFHDNVCIDPSHVGLTLNNFASAGDPDGDGVFGEENLEEFGLTVADFSVRYTTYPSGTKSFHRGVSVNNTGNTDSPFGYLHVTNLTYVDISGDKTSSAISATDKWTHISVDGMRIVHSDIEYDEAATPAPILFSNTRAGGSLTLRDVDARFDGEIDATVVSSGHNVYSRLFLLMGEDLHVDIENVRVEIDLRNFGDSNNKYAVFEIGHNGTQMPSRHATISGRIANVVATDVTSSPDDNPYLFRFGSGLVIDDDLFFVNNIKTCGLTDSTNLIFYDDSVLERADRVFMSGIVITFPCIPGESVDADSDDDYDGIPNDVEVANGLNPLNGTDAVQDLDGDGISNLNEYLANTDIRTDSTPPELIIPTDVVVNSAGSLTIVDLGEATAIDRVDGVLTPVPDPGGPFAPGSYSVTWTATDTAGNSVQASQAVAVYPQVNLGPDHFVGEGKTVRIPVILNGAPPDYPVTIPYTVGGTATKPEDHDLSSGNLTIASGTEGYIVYRVVDDGTNNEGRENIVISLGVPVNAVVGPMGANTVTIVEENLPPRVQLVIDQNGHRSREITPAEGVVTVQAQVDDPNPRDSHTFDWGLTDNNLVDTDGDSTNDTIVFEPGSLSTGIYKLQVRVMDDGTPVASVLTQLDIRVVDSMPALSSTADSDGDGVSDLLEGLSDGDSDGLPDYLDRYANHILPAVVSIQDRYLVETEPGLTLRMGQTGFAANTGNLTVDQTQIDNFAPTGGGVDTEDDLNAAGSYFDFEIANLPLTGQSVRIVLPLFSQVPESPVYRKFIPNTGWQDFVMDSGNAISSAPGVKGVCPPPGDATYTTGLTPGDWCVELTLEDGGPNDADYEANGVINDPGGVATTAATVASTNAASSSSGGGGGGGGGCALQQDGPPDPTLPLLVLYSLFYIARFRYLMSRKRLPLRASKGVSCCGWRARSVM